MFPILFSIGPVHIYSFSVFLILSWCVFSFLFWKKLRSAGVTEERIFDLMFYGTLVSFVAARVGFVATHGSLFTDNMLKVVALWVTPGLSFVGAFASLVTALMYLSRRYKIRVGLILDTCAGVFPWAFLVGGFGFLLGGGTKILVGASELLFFLLLGILLWFLEKRAAKYKWPYGLVGIFFFLLFSLGEFALEFFKGYQLYYWGVSANGWVYVALFAESVGAFYVRYAKFSKRHT